MTEAAVANEACAILLKKVRVESKKGFRNMLALGAASEVFPDGKVVRQSGSWIIAAGKAAA